MKKFGLLVALALLLGACAPGALTRYNVSIQKADCDGPPCSQCGEKRFQTANVGLDNVLHYKDANVSADFIFFPESISMSLENRGKQTVKLSWDDSLIVSPRGVSHGIVHSGTRFIDRNNSQKSSIIAGGTKILEFFYPADLIAYRNPINGPIYIPGGWVSMPFLDPGTVGKNFSVLLAMKKDDAKMEYRFHFNVDGMIVPPPSPRAMEQ